MILPTRDSPCWSCYENGNKVDPPTRSIPGVVTIDVVVRGVVGASCCDKVRGRCISIHHSTWW